MNSASSRSCKLAVPPEPLAQLEPQPPVSRTHCSEARHRPGVQHERPRDRQGQGHQEGRVRALARAVGHPGMNTDRIGTTRILEALSQGPKPRRSKSRPLQCPGRRWLASTIRSTSRGREVQGADLLALKFWTNVHASDIRKHIVDHSSFEMYRRLSNSCDPHAEGQDVALYDQANNMREKIAKHFDDTCVTIRK